MVKMKSYFVTWEIDIDADSPREAAQKALEIQRDPHSIAVVFRVAYTEFDDKGNPIDHEQESVDLNEEEA